MILASDKQSQLGASGEELESGELEENAAVDEYPPQMRGGRDYIIHNHYDIIS